MKNFSIKGSPKIKEEYDLLFIYFPLFAAQVIKAFVLISYDSKIIFDILFKFIIFDKRYYDICSIYRQTLCIHYAFNSNHIIKYSLFLIFVYFH